MRDTVYKIMNSQKGVLALDWSPATIAKQFEKVDLISSAELNRIYRQLLVKAPGIEKYLSAIILHDETINQKLDGGESFPEFLQGKDIVVGVRADEGSEKYKDSDQNMTKGLENLSERLKRYQLQGVRFSKWRAGFKISDLYPSNEFIDESTSRLTEFASISHKFDMVPFVEPDVEITGNHTTTRCEEVTTKVLKRLFFSLKEKKIDLSKVILKTNMVLPGVDSGVLADPLEIANATLRAFDKSVPKDIGGIVFLSGGQSYDDSVSFLDKIEDLAKLSGLPWKISFSFARSLQSDALKTWSGEDNNVISAQKALVFRLEKAVKARKGEL